MKQKKMNGKCFFHTTPKLDCNLCDGYGNPSPHPVAKGNGSKVAVPPNAEKIVATSVERHTNSSQESGGELSLIKKRIRKYRPEERL